ncbi:hypothetical protein J6590_017437 [Homalodisca vitripennis]|nr:hypothetical protein J6590_017437 [Homalodisca vitripennis]
MSSIYKSSPGVSSLLTSKTKTVSTGFSIEIKNLRRPSKLETRSNIDVNIKRSVGGNNPLEVASVGRTDRQTRRAPTSLLDGAINQGPVMSMLDPPRRRAGRNHLLFLATLGRPRYPRQI